MTVWSVRYIILENVEAQNASILGLELYNWMIWISLGIFN